MKKLIMVATIVCAAVSAQAAVLSWSTYGYTLSEGTTGIEVWNGSSATAYLIQITDAANFAVADDLTITGGQIINTALNDGWGTFIGELNTVLENGSSYQFAILLTSKAGTMDSLPTDGFYGVDRNGGNATTFYEGVWNADTGLSIGPNENIFYGTAITTAVVPEPTSGLLLLLGMGALALRRKRA